MTTRWLLLPEVLEPGLRGLGDRLRIPERGVFPVVDISDDPCDPFLEAHRGLPAELGRDLADVGVGTLGFAGTFRNMDFFTAEELDQAIHRLRVARAEVPDAPGRAGLRGREEGAGHVGHIEEIARLAAIA